MSTGTELDRILYVEDEPDIREVAKLALEMVGGFTVEICASGAEAIARAPGFAPQLVLLDVMMPVMDGPTTLEALRALPGFADTPVAFMTAKTQAREIERFETMGIAGVIPKPFDPMTLADEVRALWKTRRAAR